MGRRRSPRRRLDRGLCRARRLRARAPGRHRLRHPLCRHPRRPLPRVPARRQGLRLGSQASSRRPSRRSPPVERPGRAGYGTRNQSRRRDEPTNAWDAFRFPLHRPGADLRGTEVPHTVREWAADTWADAERLEAAIAGRRGHFAPMRFGRGRPPVPAVDGTGRSNCAAPTAGHHHSWFGWCFVKCPGSYRRDGTPCPDGARCLRPVNYPPLLGRPHEHHECAKCAPPSPGQRFAD